MTATNHFVTGALIGLTIHVPIVALPLAFVSHFAMDALPHFGDRKQPAVGMRWLKAVLPFDILLATTMMLAIIIAHPMYWQFGVASGILAASPDLRGIPIFIYYLKHQKLPPLTGWYDRFNHFMQWGERLWGAWIELIWFLIFGGLLLARL